MHRLCDIRVKNIVLTIVIIGLFAGCSFKKELEQSGHEDNIPTKVSETTNEEQPNHMIAESTEKSESETVADDLYTQQETEAKENVESSVESKDEVEKDSEYAVTATDPIESMPEEIIPSETTNVSNKLGDF